MYKPKITPLGQHSPDQLEPLPDSFTLLAWNLQKVDFSDFLLRPIEQLIEVPAPHLLSLQEASTLSAQNRFFNFPFAMTPNIQTAKGHYGVLTASPHPIKPYQQHLTRAREIGLTTHKPALITQHPLANGQILTHVNIHAINFVSNKVFNQELEYLWAFLSYQTGPMVISGDFNTWNKTRFFMLEKATRSLNLEMVAFPDSKPIKTMLNHPLDHIFYRELTLQDAHTIAVPNISDHNPLIATFQIYKDPKNELTKILDNK